MTMGIIFLTLFILIVSIWIFIIMVIRTVLKSAPIEKFSDGYVPNRGILNRDVNMEEGAGMPGNLGAGTFVYLWTERGFYEEPSRGNVFVSPEPNKHPFFEIPVEAVDWDDPMAVEIM